MGETGPFVAVFLACLDVPLAALAALSAVAVVCVAGVVVRAPLVRVPENAVKFAVGVMLTSFGTFWAAEGAGARWPGGELALLVVVAAVGLYSLLLVAILRRFAAPAASPASQPATS